MVLKDRKLYRSLLGVAQADLKRVCNGIAMQGMQEGVMDNQTRRLWRYSNSETKLLSGRRLAPVRAVFYRLSGL